MAGNTNYKNKYNLEKYDRINVTVNKGDKDKIKEKAESLGISINSYIRGLIMNDLENKTTSRKNEKDMEIYLF